MNQQLIPHQNPTGLGPRAHLPAVAVMALLLGVTGASGYLLGMRFARPLPVVSAPTPVSPDALPSPGDDPHRRPLASSASGPAGRPGWRAYRNDTYGYAIHHPAGWLVTESYPDVAVAGVRVFHAIDTGPASAGGYASGTPLVLVRVMALDGRTAEIARALISSTRGVVGKGQVVMNGVSGERWVAADGRAGEGLFFVHNSRRYVIGSEGGPTADAVVRSFRFE